MDELGYRIDENLRLRHISTGKNFEFTNQKHYNEVGDKVTEFLQQLLVEKYRMKRVELPLNEYLPEGKFSRGSKCPVFLSSNADTAVCLIILICGAGKVEAGQWARKLCINDSLLTGSVLTYLEWAHKENISVLILNPNYRTKEDFSVPLNENRTKHVIYAWDSICRNLPVEKIAIIGHSCGGYDACELLKARESEVLKRLKCIVFCDSGQESYVEDLPCVARNFVVTNAIDFVASNQPLGRMIKKSSPSENRERKGGASGNCCFGFGKSSKANEYRCREVSAGTASHDETPVVALPEVTKFILSKLS